MRKDSIRSQFLRVLHAVQRRTSFRGALSKDGHTSPGRFPLEGKSPVEGKPFDEKSLLDERAVLHLIRSAFEVTEGEASRPMCTVGEEGSPIVQPGLPVGIIQLGRVATRQHAAEFVVEIDALVAMEDYSIAAISMQTIFGGKGVRTRLTFASDSIASNHKAPRKRSRG